ncbi:DDE superfamily endonuclease [Popillia japonica]
MSAGGQYVPPMLIFPTKNRNDQLMRGAPPGSIYAVHPSGWIQHNLFTQRFQHFIQFVKKSENDPVLLIADGHYSHTRNMDVINLARENHVSIISLPPYSTHKLQPLDKTFMGSFKAYYSEEIRKWIRKNQLAVTIFVLVELLANALLKAETSEIAKKGFEVTGIYKLNRHIFSDANFIAEEIDAEKRCNSSTIIKTTSEATTVDEPQPGCSKSGTTNSTSNSPNWCGSQDFISPFQISPIPGIRKKTSNRGRKTSKSQIITSSPYKNELEIFQAKPEADRGKRKLWQIKKNSQPMKGKGKKKQQIIESSGSEAESEFLAADEYSDMDEVGAVPPQNADVTCMFCDSSFSQDSQGELWVCCLMGQLWAHDECAGAEKVAYVCDFCK